MAEKYTVVSGDCLSIIGEKKGVSWHKIAEWNNINPPYLIHPGDVLYVEKPTSSGSSGSSSSPYTIYDVKLGLQSMDDKTLLATWKYKYESQTEKYKVYWTYTTGDGIRYGNSKDITVDHDNRALSRYDTFTIPAEAKVVYFKAKPISKTYKKQSGDKEVDATYWDGKFCTELKHTVAKAAPTKPSAPSISIDKYKLTMSLTNIATDTKYIVFEIVQNNNTKPYATKQVTVATRSVSYTHTVSAGSEYKVRCKALNSSKIESEWSDYSGSETTIPAAPTGIVSLTATTTTSVEVKWNAVSKATEYQIEYTSDKNNFDKNQSAVSTERVNAITNSNAHVTRAIVNGLETGNEYFFRMCASNSKGSTVWTPVKSIILGQQPSVPTTWSSTTTAITNEPVTLYWVHNTVDGSAQQAFCLYYGYGKNLEARTIEGRGQYELKDFAAGPQRIEPQEEDEDSISLCVVDGSLLTQGSKFIWAVETAGIAKDDDGEWMFSDMSVQRTIEIYATPTLQFGLQNSSGGPISSLNSFPVYAYAQSTGDGQIPIGYHLSVVSNDSYETVDNVGNVKMVNAGDAVYSKYFDAPVDNKNILKVELSPSNIDLENNVTYTAECTVSMDSGLTATDSYEFNVTWADAEYAVNAEIGINTDDYTAQIRPYCGKNSTVYKKVTYQAAAGIYTVTNEGIDPSKIDSVYISANNPKDDCRVLVGDVADYGNQTYYYESMDTLGNVTYYRVTRSVDTFNKPTNPYFLDARGVKPAYTITGEEVLLGKMSSGQIVFYCIQETTSVIDGVTLGVYRREYDGSFTEIATGLPSTEATVVIDPHPALDFARYRIVATTATTGAVSYTDLPGHYVGCDSIVIQWDEEWSSYNSTNEDPLAEPPWSGSLLKLPYNHKGSTSTKPDVALVEYIGRSKPVSYYGTQLGESASWNTDVVKSDTETLYALRRLSMWQGDVYFREPSGAGYWANITVSYSQDSGNLVIPVSLSVTRVEGGM